MTELIKALLGSTPALIILLVTGIVLCFAALLGRIESKFINFDLKWWQRLLAVIFGFILVGLAALAIVPQRLDSIPPGTVVMWFGRSDDLPVGYELCDGAYSKALKRNRPNLVERFVRGAAATERSPDDLKIGGKDAFPLPPHEHTIQSHTHGTTSLYARWGRRSAQSQDNRIYQQELRGTWRGGDGLGPGIAFTEGNNPSAESHGTAIYGETDAPKESLKTISTSEVQIDNRPAFHEMFFIIKVAE